MSKSTSVKITDFALDVEGGSLIIRGRLDPTTLGNIQTDDYQREILPRSTIDQLMEGVTKGDAPDIELGMRGSRTIEEEKNHSIWLHSPVYVVDGLQRLTAARQLLMKGKPIRLGATIRVDTTRETERERFKLLNADRTKVSSNILLRNLRDDFPVVATLLSLCDSGDNFVMKGRVCWAQRQQRGHLISAMMFSKVTGILHGHIGAGKGTSWSELAAGLQKIMEKTGPNILRDNLRSFFDLLEEAWGITSVVYTEGAAHLKGNFMFSLARILSDHVTFWKGHRLFVAAKWRNKLRLFKIADPTIQQLASSGGQARHLLYELMVKHLNAGAKTHRLKRR